MSDFTDLNNIIKQGPQGVTASSLRGSKSGTSSDGEVKVSTLMVNCFNKIASGKNIIIKAAGEEAGKALIYFMLDGYLCFYWRIFCSKVRAICRNVGNEFTANGFKDKDSTELEGNDKAIKIVNDNLNKVGELIAFDKNQKQNKLLSNFGELLEKFKVAYGEEHWSKPLYAGIIENCNTLGTELQEKASAAGIAIESARSSELKQAFYNVALEPILNAISEYKDGIDKVLESGKDNSLYLGEKESIKSGKKSLTADAANTVLYSPTGDEMADVLSKLFSGGEPDESLGEEFIGKFKSAQEIIDSLKISMDDKWGTSKGETEKSESEKSEGEPASNNKEGEPAPDNKEGDVPKENDQ